MIYAPNAAMSNTKMWFGPTLGAWHSYKQANAIIFRMFQSEFFVQLHFEMFPGQPFFFGQKKLTKNVVLFSWIRLAYPSFKEKLSAAIKHMEETNSGSKAGYRHLLNLKFLCEWLIPVVLSIVGTCASFVQCEISLWLGEWVPSLNHHESKVVCIDAFSPFRSSRDVLFFLLVYKTNLE